MAEANTMDPQVLYVEDEESDRFFMERAFAKEGCGAALQLVSSGEEAIDYLSGKASYADRKKHPFPAVVLLDLNLGALHGFEVLEWIRAQPAYASLPVVIYSSSVRDEDHETARRLRANGFVTKPSSPSVYSEVVRILRERWLNPGGSTEGAMSWSGVVTFAPQYQFIRRATTQPQ